MLWYFLFVEKCCALNVLMEDPPYYPCDFVVSLVSVLGIEILFPSFLRSFYLCHQHGHQARRNVLRFMLYLYNDRSYLLYIYSSRLVIVAIVLLAILILLSFFLFDFFYYHLYWTLTSLLESNKPIKKKTKLTKK